MSKLRKSVVTILIGVLIASCGNVTPVPTVTSTESIPPTITAISPTSTALPIATDTPSPTPTLPVSSAPDGLRMAYVIDGNLYFQDGSKLPVQLTDSGEDRQPIFTDDGEKIVFRRGKLAEEIYSINIDGSQEQLLITGSLLMSLDTLYNESTYVHSLTVIPGTHQLLFGTQGSLSSMPRWNNDLLMVDADTAEIKRILPPRHVSSFYVSPDGRFIAIDKIGSIDVIDLDGDIIHKNLLTYTPSAPVFLPPGIFWISDSVGLVILLPVPTIYESDYLPDYTTWRYVIDDDIAIQVSIEPLPMEHYMAEVSPDGSWILYNREDQNIFYIGDLRTGDTEIYDPQPFIFHYDWRW